MTPTKGESPNPKGVGRPHVIDGDTSHLHIRVSPKDKARWTKAAMAHYQATEGGKGGLSDWVKMILNSAAQTKES